MVVEAKDHSEGDLGSNQDAWTDGIPDPVAQSAH